jgi:hypothetical protein
MRIIGLGLLALLLTGTALTLSGYDILQTGIERITDKASDTPLVFEPDTSGMDVSHGTQAGFLRIGASAPLILSGLPSYGTARFGLPITARPQSGYLQIDTTLQSLAGVEGLLRISIDNSRRGDILLAPGLVARSVQIPLTAEDLANEALNVSFSLIGNAPATGCSSDDHLAVVAEIEASSALVLTLDTPLNDVADRIIAWGDDTRIGWSQNLSAQDRAERLAMAGLLGRQGASVSFHETNGLGMDALRSAYDNGRPSRSRRLSDRSFPMPLQANSGLREFKNSTTWRNRYKLDEANGAEIPGRLDLNLRLGPLSQDAQWTVSATLNGRLLMADILPIGTRDFASSLDLPTEDQGSTNLIEVSATSSQNLPGKCNDGPDLIAELTESSVLMGSGEILTGPLTELRSVLQAYGTLSVSAAADMTAADAQTYARMIATTLPDTVSLEAASGNADITPLTRAQTAALTQADIADTSAWVVYRDADLGTLRAEPGASYAMIAVAARAPLALLIKPHHQRTAEVTQ